MLKKILSATLAALMVLSIAACKKEDTSSDIQSTTSEISSVGTQSENTQSEDKTESTPTDSTESKKEDNTPSKQPEAEQKCEHKFSKATCTAAAKCTLCGEVSGKALGHSYSAGKCTRCGAADQNYATYKQGSKDTIIRTTLNGKSTTLKIDISSANSRLSNSSNLDPNAKMDISYKDFLEVDGYLYFSQNINLKYTFSGRTYDVKVDELYKIKTDGTNQTVIVCFKETEEKSLSVGEIFGFIGNTVYYTYEDDDNGTTSIYKATVSSKLTSLITQGTKVADSANEYASMYNTSIKNGQLYFSEEAYKINPETNLPGYVQLGSYKINANGTGLTKIS